MKNSSVVDLQEMKQIFLYGTIQSVSKIKLSDKGLVISFKSNTGLNDALKPISTFTIDIGNDMWRFMVDEIPHWVLLLKEEHKIRSDKHFHLVIHTENMENPRWELLDEKLLYLNQASSYRDGGSMDATWITNYGNKWSLCLKVATFDNVHYTQKYSNLYNCRLNRIGGHNPVIKGTQEDAKIITKLEEWLNAPVFLNQSNKEMMDKYSAFREMYWRLPFRIY